MLILENFVRNDKSLLSLEPNWLGFLKKGLFFLKTLFQETKPMAAERVMFLRFEQHFAKIVKVAKRSNKKDTINKLKRACVREWG